MPTRTQPSTSQNQKPSPSQWSSRPVRNSGARKNSPTANAKAMIRVMPISFLPSSSSSSPSDSLAEMVSARTPMTSDSTRATMPRTIGHLSTQYFFW